MPDSGKTAGGLHPPGSLAVLPRRVLKADELHDSAVLQVPESDESPGGQDAESILSLSEAGNIASALVAGRRRRQRGQHLGVQYFVTYNLPNGWFLYTNATNTADWTKDAVTGRTVPMGGGFSNVFTLGRQGMSHWEQGNSNVIKPPTSATKGLWKLGSDAPSPTT